MPRPPAHRSASVAVVAFAAVLAVLLPWSAEALDRGPAPQPAPGGPYLGALLDWSTDSPGDYRRRSGVSPTVYGVDAPLPLQAADVANLRAALDAAATQGAGLLVSLRPTVPLSSVDAAAVDAVTDGLSAAGVGRTTPVWLRPMPEMNGSWERYGQQPTAFVRVFDELADAVHERLPRTAMVWQPAYGAGYPFSSPDRPQAQTRDAALDTDGDGRLTGGDDPYGPYWPKASSVDWVGLGLLHYGRSFPVTRNDPPVEGQLRAQLSGRYGYPDPREGGPSDFYARFVTGAGKPMVLQTAARFAASQPGASEVSIKRPWIAQVDSVLSGGAHADIGMVVWQELRRREPPTPGLVDWRVTHLGPVAEDFRRLAEEADLTTARGAPSGSPAPTSGPEVSGTGTVLAGGSAVVVAAVAMVAALALALVAARRRTATAYVDGEGGGGRDLRIDLLRGVAICFVVIDHVNIPSLWQLLTHELVGPVTGAELFVALSGVVLGVINRRRGTGLDQWYDSGTRMWRRALTLWVTALAVVVVIYLVALLPGVDARVVTTYTDPGAGGGSTGARVYDLYAGFSSLGDFPVPGWAIRDVLLLRMGPSQINIIGLYVVLLLLAPLMTWLLTRGWWPVLATLSLGAYAVFQVRPLRVLPSQFEDPFPLLSWQVLFVLGLVAGWHLTTLSAAAARPAGRAAVVLVALVTVAFAIFSWNNPSLSNAYDVRLALVPDATFQRVYDEWFARTTLGPGRLVATACLLVTAFAALTRFWAPVHRTLGWFLVPLGQATLYVFVLHVFLVVAVANLPALTESVLLGTLTHAVLLCALWLMVRRRFLFRVVPR